MFAKHSLKERPRKRLGFFHRVQRFLKRSYLGAASLLLVLSGLLNLLLLSTEQSPAAAKVPEVVPLVQNSSNPFHLVQQGKNLYEAQRFTDAVGVWQQAAQVYQSQSDRLNQAKVFSFLSLAYQQLGQWEEANKAIALSLQLLKNNRLHQTKDFQLILAQALNTQGHLQLALGQPELALTTWRQATATYAQAGNEAGVNGSLINSAQALQNLGFYRRANKTLTQLQQSLQNRSDSQLKVTGLLSLGNALRAVGDLDSSRRVLQQGLQIAQKLKSERETAAIFISLGNTALAQQDKETAQKFYQQAIAASASSITRVEAQLNQLNLFLEAKSKSDAWALSIQILPEIANLPPSRTAIYAKINFARSLVRLRQISTERTFSWQEIGQMLATAVQQARSIKDTRSQAYALGYLGGLYESSEQLSSAFALTEQALNLAQTINASDITYLWQWQLGRILKAQGNIVDAIAYYHQAVNTLQSLRSDLVAINAEVQFSFRESVEPVYRELVSLLLQQRGTSRPNQTDIQLARNTIESLQLAELNNFFRSACLDNKVAIDKVIDYEDPTAAFIYAIILDQRLEIIVKLPRQKVLHHYSTNVAQNKIESTITSLREDLLDVTQTSAVKKRSQQLYQWLIQPAEVDLASSGIKNLVFVLDGSLQNIPMSVLYDSNEQKYLVEKYGLALTPGLQLVAPRPLQQVKLKALTAGIGEKRSINGREFAPLKNVRFELSGIGSIVSRSKELIDQEFTENNLQKQMKSTNFSIVHLATHGEFSSNPEETFILTWNQLLKVKDFDNLLRASDKSGSSAIELFVLSACKTALGDKRAALGLAGVAVQAGARSTLATLWSVDDESTTELMTQFYQQLKTGVSKAEALQRAQLAVLKHEKRPYFWAPYVLVGNWL
jgi:CHAT domain-containing protein